MDPTTQRILLGSSGAGESYWIATYSEPISSYTRTGYRVTIDSSQNVYVHGWAGTPGSGQGNAGALLLKYNSSGSLVFEKSYGTAGQDYGYGVVTDSSGNVYISGGLFSNDCYLSKLTSGGIISWSKQITPGSYGGSQFTVDVDSSNNPITGGYFYDAGNGAGALFVQKYDSSGTLLWTNGLTRYYYSINYQQVKYDSSGNVWFFGTWPDPSASGYGLIFGYFNSTGTFISARSVYASSYTMTLTNLGGWDIDTNNNICMACNSTNTGTGYNWTPVVKVDNSYNILWSRVLSSTGFNLQGYDCATDTLNNVYVTGKWQVGGSNLIFLAKYNSSGVLQWQRYIQDVTGNIVPLAVTTDSKNNVYITASRASTAGLATFKLPSDGSKTGTYGSFIYDSSSFTDASFSVNIQPPGFGTTGPSPTTPSYSFFSIDLAGSAATISL